MDTDDGVATLGRFPKISVPRSKRLLKPQLLPYQYWGLQLCTSLTEVQLFTVEKPY